MISQFLSGDSTAVSLGSVEVTPFEQTSVRTLDYRPDVDGLRAVAIIAVVVFHAFPTVIPGGFVGVDIFFVISGYLIAGIIFEEIHSGTFRISRFL